MSYSTLRLLPAVALFLSLAAYADVPSHYYCGGAVEYFANGWWQQLAPQGAQSGVLPLTISPQTCPDFSTKLIFPGGIGDTQMVPAMPSRGGAIDNYSLYYSVTPSNWFGTAGVLGQVLGQMFGGPEYSPMSQKMSVELSNIRKLSNQIVDTLNSDRSYVQSQLSIQGLQARNDVTRLEAAAQVLEKRDIDDSNRLAASISLRPTLPPTVPETQLDSVLDLLEQKRTIAEIAASIPPENLRPDGSSMFGALDGMRTASFGGLSDLAKALAREEAKLNGAIATTAATNGSATVLYTRAAAALATAEKFSRSVSPAALDIAEALLMEARTDRYAALGRMHQGAAAIAGPDGSIALRPLGPDDQMPPDSVVQDAANFVGMESVARSELTSAEAVIATRTGVDRERAEELLNLSAAMIDRAEMAYFGGRLPEGKFLAAGAIRFLVLARDYASAPPDLLTPETRAELAEFGKSLFGTTLDAAHDNMIGEIGRIATDVEGLDAVFGVFRDFAAFNTALVSYTQAPTEEKLNAVEFLGVKFGFSLTATSFATAVATAASLSAGWIVAAGVAAGVAADYAARALILEATHPPKPAPTPIPPSPRPPIP
jgi:hypothetical protein